MPRRGGARHGERRQKKVADATSADVELADALESLDGAENYRDWILRLSVPALADARSVLELGAGTGTFTRELARSVRVTAVEIGASAAAALRDRFADSSDVTVLEADLKELGSSAFDAAFLSNVLEHIKDDVRALRELARVVRPGGSVVVFSPAFPLLYSDFDARVGHHHRYRLPELRRRFESAGLEVSDARYVNMAGFFTWLALVRLLGLTPKNRTLVATFDRFVVPVMRRFESVFRPPLGQSVFVVGRVPD